MSSQKVLMCRYRRTDARIKLICFPWAGGGAVFYSNWGRLFPDTVEVHAVCLAGRECRFDETPSSDVDTVIEQLASAVYDACKEEPFVFWGHSMGSYLSYLTATRLKSGHGMEPVHMFVSGAPGPFSKEFRDKAVDTSLKTDEELIENMKSMGGTPNEILHNREVLSLFLPNMKSDLMLVYNMRQKKASDIEVKLSCPVDVLEGNADTPRDLQAWGDITTGPLMVTYLDGGHFYIKEKRNEKIIVTNILEKIDLFV